MQVQKLSVSHATLAKSLGQHADIFVGNLIDKRHGGPADMPQPVADRNHGRKRHGDPTGGKALGFHERGNRDRFKTCLAATLAIATGRRLSDRFSSSTRPASARERHGQAS